MFLFCSMNCAARFAYHAVCAGSSLVQIATVTGPVTVAIWTNDDPAQTAWYAKRAAQFMEQNKNIKVELQKFPTGDLAKKVSVAYATGSAPEGFVSFDFVM